MPVLNGKTLINFYIFLYITLSSKSHLLNSYIDIYTIYIVKTNNLVKFSNLDQLS